MMGEEFYDRARATRQFEVVDVMLGGLKEGVTEEDIRDIARGNGCHVVKVVLDMDPVTNRCKGRAKATIRESKGDPGVKRFTHAMAALGIHVQ